ncbi:alpha beta hydrolase family [Niveomyces insectorum RCEF 264]|uniref:Alpha beta hydrolase family n=1 Tax=Niveomyces insectorum RCEF 264 TaxID=1081102 RepID=A0A162MDT1_9HYPO|nr:alpha beta hydrolase family [Niveomyces insectorum RCEF 264]
MSFFSSTIGGTVAATAVATAALLAISCRALYPRHAKAIASPLRTVLPKLSPDQVARLDYTPDAFPGARDVSTPYGSIRVYEFGPVDGRKVLMVHGISTSCQTLGPIAHGLVAHAGCRVMLFDLFGRGFSDGVGDLPHDARLYTSQMLLALASSALPWTGDAAFDLLGYSMGGGVAVHFVAAFPRMLRSLILLAPAGLVRPERFGAAARFVFTSGLVPERLLAAITRRRLRRPISSRRTEPRQKDGPSHSSSSSKQPSVLEKSTQPIDASVAEVVDVRDTASELEHPEPRGSDLGMRVMRYVGWMLTHHEGFVPAFMSCIRDAPLVGQQAVWARLAAIVRGSQDGQEKQGPGLSLCLVFGRLDEVVNAEDYAADLLPMLGGKENATWEVVPGGHEFPMTYSRHVLRIIFTFWGEPEGALVKLQEEGEAELRAAGQN